MVDDQVVTPEATTKSGARRSFWHSQAAGALVEAFGSLIGPITEALLPRPADQLTALQIELAKIELARQSALVNPPVVALSPEDLVGEERMDWVFLGPRGSGKTATACYMGQGMSEAQGLPLGLVGWKPEMAERLGGVAMHPKKAFEAEDMVLIFDEASLRIAPGRRDGNLFEMLALARHRNLSCLWTSQTSSAVHRDVLRMEAGYVFLGFDPISRLLDREELLDVHATAESIMMRNPKLLEVGGAVVLVEGRYGMVEGIPLPDGWDERVSKLWR